MKRFRPPLVTGWATKPKRTGWATKPKRTGWATKPKRPLSLGSWALSYLYGTLSLWCLCLSILYGTLSLWCWALSNLYGTLSLWCWGLNNLYGIFDFKAPKISQAGQRVCARRCLPETKLVVKARNPPTHLTPRLRGYPYYNVT